MIRPSTHEIAKLLNKALSTEQKSALLNEPLCVEADPKYTDRESEIGRRLFDWLGGLDEAAVEMACGN